MKIFERIKFYLIFALPGLVILYPVLFNGEIFSDSDAVLQLYPALQFLKDSLSSGESFIWNSHVMTGFVTAAGLMGGFFSKLNQVVYQNFSVVSGYNWLTFLSFWLTSIFTFELARKLSLKKLTSIFVALSSPWIMANFLWIGNSTVTSGLFVLPLLLYMVLVFRSKQIIKNLVISIVAGLVVGTIAISYHFQWLLQIFVVVGVLAVVLDWQSRKLKTMPWLALTGIVTALIAWPQYKLLFQLLPFSARGEGLSFTGIQGGMVIPGDLLSVIFPTLSLPSILIHPGFFYIGSVTLLFFIYSLFIKKNSSYKFFAWTLIISLLISIKYSPVAWVLHQLPGFASFRELSRFMYVGLFAAVMMAGYGFEAFFLGLTSARIDKAKLWLWRIAVFGFGLFIGISIVFNIFREDIKQKAVSVFEANYNVEDLSLPQEHYYQVIDRMIAGIESGTTWPHTPVTVSLISLLLAAAIIRYSHRLNYSKAAALLLLISILNLGLVNQAQFKTRTTSAASILEPPAVVDYLKAQPDQEFRVMTLFPGSATFNLLDTPYGYNPHDNVALMSNLLVPNLNVLYGIDSLDYYDNLMDTRHAKILAYLGSDRAQADDKLVDLDIPFEEKINLFLERLPVAAAYNVKYIISAYDLTHSGLNLVFTWIATSHEIPLYLYELAEPRLRYYLTSEVKFSDTTSESDLWNENLDAISQKITLLECPDCAEVSTGQGTWQLTKESRGEYVFNINIATSQYFVFGQNLLPGWQAFVDSQEVDIYRANFVNQAVLIESGEHEVRFIYE